jgi:hypothetical protein
MKTGIVSESPSQGISGIRQDKMLFGIVPISRTKKPLRGQQRSSHLESKSSNSLMISGLSVFHDSGLNMIVACPFLKIIYCRILELFPPPRISKLLK